MQQPRSNSRNRPSNPSHAPDRAAPNATRGKANSISAFHQTNPIKLLKIRIAFRENSVFTLKNSQKIAFILPKAPEEQRPDASHAPFTHGKQSHNMIASTT